MFLKTLTLRGFKSFASATTLSLEPGITAVVGPNGSGKSNVVDALAWVMGEQGAKNLRGGNMADVIFAGTSSRTALGRAQVELTIDNTDGALPIEYSEVTISRTLFRGGGSEYSINGTPVRLLDIQELLSDTGMGRQMHVIVGQGQLDAILSSTPEERRGFIEEAAGVLKHRRRKERALKKLADTDANLVRVLDLARELGRQLKPLARQAQAARKAGILQAHIRDTSARLLADELATATERLATQTQADEVIQAKRDHLDNEIAALRQTLAALEDAHGQDSPRLTQATSAWQRATAATEKLRGILMAAQERASHFAVQSLPPSDEDPDDLDRQAHEAQNADRDAMDHVARAQEQLADAIEQTRAAEEADEQASRELAKIHRLHAEHREKLARITGDIAAAQSRYEAAQDAVENAERTLASAQERARHAQEACEGFTEENNPNEESPAALAHSRALAARDEARQRVDELLTRERNAREERAHWEARRDTLAQTLAPRDATARIIDEPTILGTLPSLMTVQEGWENAISAALHPFTDAAVATSWDDARRLASSIPTEESLHLLIAHNDPHPPADRPHGAKLPDGGAWASDYVTIPSQVDATVRHLLGGTVVIEELDADLVAALFARPDVDTIVTRAGDTLHAWALKTAGHSTSSVLHIQAQYQQAQEHCEHASQVERSIATQLTEATTSLDQCIIAANKALKALRDYDAEIAQAAQIRAKATSAAQAAHSEAQRAQAALTRAQEQSQWAHDAWQHAQQRADSIDTDNAPTQDDVDAAQQRAQHAAAQAKAHREEQTELRLRLRALEEQSRQAQARARNLRAAAANVRQAQIQWHRHEQGRQQRYAIARAVVEQCEYALAHAQRLCAQAETERQAAQEERNAHSQQITDLRHTIDEKNTELASVTAAIHRDQVAQAELSMRVEQLQERALSEVHMDAQELLSDYGPHNLVPIFSWEALKEAAHAVLTDKNPEPTPHASHVDTGETTPAPSSDTHSEGTPGNLSEEAPEAANHDENPHDSSTPMRPYVREELSEELQRARQELDRLGKVNPLALEEHAALEARHSFLMTQINDIKKSQADLMTIIADVDSLVETAFRTAFEDTATHFAHIFDVLFPGGQGTLSLTDPDDMLHTGIEIEARPAGKKVKRLSLLSGGERSLAAMAFLIAIFQARPSPFYVMDEVEAALDDVNLSRLLAIFQELQKTSQLIVITHQKRTMEIADVLYGVTMREGVTRVVSQRMNS